MKVYFIDSRNVIAHGGPDVLKRHEVYASKFSSTFKELDSKLLIASKISKSSIYSEPQIIRGYSKYYLKYFSGILSSVRSQQRDCITLIAGDPWHSGFTAIMLKGFLKAYKIDVKVQIQLHADICDANWIKSSWKNRFKSKIALKMLDYCDSIRFVSELQKDLVSKYKCLEHKQTLVIPVLLDLENKKFEISKNRPRVIGFVGRMEKDRGTRNLVELVEKLTINSNLDFKIKLIGSGKDKARTLRELERILGAENIISLEHLSQAELIREWAQIGVLVNLAPSESYGRTMREAAFFGIPVWSVYSNGFEELRRNFSVSWIKELKLIDSPRELKIELDELFELETNSEVRNQLLSQQATNLEKLIHSWNCHNVN